MGLSWKKWPKLEEIIAAMPQHGHIKDQVAWHGAIYEFEGWTTLDKTGLLTDCHMLLVLNKAETKEWIKKGKA